MILPRTALVIIALAAGLVAITAQAQPAPDAPATLARGQAVFSQRCKDCHDPAIGEAPDKKTIAMKPPAEIFEILKSGLMQPMAEGLSDSDMRAVAAWLTATSTAPP